MSLGARLLVTLRWTRETLKKDSRFYHEKHGYGTLYRFGPWNTANFHHRLATNGPIETELPPDQFPVRAQLGQQDSEAKTITPAIQLCAVFAQTAPAQYGAPEGKTCATRASRSLGFASPVMTRQSYRFLYNLRVSASACSSGRYPANAKEVL